MELRSPIRVGLCLTLSIAILAPAASPQDGRTTQEAREMRSQLKSALPSPWQITGFVRVEHAEYWRADLPDFTRGYQIIWEDPTQIIGDVRSKAGGNATTKHPTIVLWLFDRTDSLTPKAFREEVESKRYPEHAQRLGPPAAFGVNEHFIAAIREMTLKTVQTEDWVQDSNRDHMNRKDLESRLISALKLKPLP